MQQHPISRQNAQKVTTIGLLCCKGFPLDSLSVALEYLQAADQMSDGARFVISVLSLHGGEVASSCGVSIHTEPVSGQAPPHQYLFLLSGPRISSSDEGLLARIVRCHLRARSVVGGLDRAVFPLARSGLFVAQEVSVSQAARDIFREQFPDLTVAQYNVSTAGRVWTAGSGFSFLSLFSAIVSQEMGQRRLNVLNRSFGDYQPRLACACAANVSTAEISLTGNASVDRAIGVFQENLETPLLMRDVARKVGISLRQMERKFSAVTGLTPKAYYMAERMDRARIMVQSTSLHVSEIAPACGFESYSTLAIQYKRRFGETPVKERERTVFEAAL